MFAVDRVTVLTRFRVDRVDRVDSVGMVVS